MWLITTLFGLERFKELKLREMIQVLHHVSVFYENKLRILIQVTHGIKKTVCKVRFLFLSRRPISTYFPLAQFCTSKGNENSRGNLIKHQQVSAVLLCSISATVAQNLRVFKSSYYINTSTYVPTDREGGKSDIVDPDIS